MSLELMRRYLVATQQFNVISTWAAMVNTPVPHSFDAGYHLDICRIPQCAGYTAHEEEIRATGSCSVGNLFICCG